MLSFLSLSLSENNILGLHKIGALTFLLEQDTFSLGEYYSDPRLLGSRFTLGESASLIVNRDSGEPEGFAAGVAVSRPLYSLATKWGFGVGLAGTRQVGRLFSGSALRTFDNPDTTTEEEALPFVYRVSNLTTDVTVVRSFGDSVKQNLKGGYAFGFTEFEYGEDDAQARAADPAVVAAFEDLRLPRSETASSVFMGYTIFTADYAQGRDFDTFALPEDFRFGPSLSLSASHSDPVIGSTTRFQTLGGLVVYRAPLGGEPVDGIVPRDADVIQLSLGYEARAEGGRFVDRQTTASVKNYSPPFWGGRFVVGVAGVRRTKDESNRVTSLGGGSGLRGYPSGQFLVRSYARANAEWRTLPIELWTFHLGLVAFYDVAALAVEGDWLDLEIVHGTGFGLRWLNPASNRIVLRFDYAFPFGGPVPTLPGTFSFGFEQAF